MPRDQPSLLLLQPSRRQSGKPDCTADPQERGHARALVDISDALQSPCQEKGHHATVVLMMETVRLPGQRRDTVNPS